MRDRFRDWVLIQTSRCLNYTGSALCFTVSKETNRVTPPSIPRDPEIVNDIAPQARWKYELLEADGEAKFRPIIVAEVKAIAQDIGNCLY